MALSSAFASAVHSLRLRVRASQFARHTGALTASNGVVAAMGLVQTVVIARWLGPQLLGVAALIMTYPSLLYAIFDTRSVDASVKYLTQFGQRGDTRRALAICKLGYAIDAAVATAAFAAVIATVGWTARHLVHQPEMAWLSVLYTVGLTSRALVGTSSAVLVSRGQFVRIAWFDALTSALRLALVVAFLSAGWQVAGIVWGTVITAWIGAIAYTISATVMVRQTWGAGWWSSSLDSLRGYRREVLGFLGYNSFTALLALIPKQLDILLLGFFRGPTETGYYKLARSFSGLVAYLVAPLQMVTYVMLNQIVAGDMAAFKNRVRRLAGQLSLPLAAVMLIGIPAAGPILHLFFGPMYDMAIRPLQFLIVGSAAWMAGFWLRPLFLAKGELRIWANISLVVVVVSLPGFLFVIPRWGQVGLAALLMVMYLAGNGAAAVYARRKGWL